MPVSVTPIAVSRALRKLGAHVSTWRKLQGITAAVLAERAGISRTTLRAIEQGSGTAGSESLMRVLRIVGVLEGVVQAADPYDTDVGRLRIDDQLPRRVRG